MRTSYLFGNKIKHIGTETRYNQEWDIWIYLEGSMKGKKAYTVIDHPLHRNFKTVPLANTGE